MFPPRSVTAITKAAFTDTAAFCTTLCTSAEVRVCTGPGGGGVGAGVRPEPHPIIPITTAGRTKIKMMVENAIFDMDVRFDIPGDSPLFGLGNCVVYQLRPLGARKGGYKRSPACRFMPDFSLIFH